MKYTLRVPRKFGNELLEEINFDREPVGADLLGLPTEFQMDHYMTLVSRLSGISMIQIKELHVSDVLQLIRVVDSFLLRTPEQTGEKS